MTRESTPGPVAPAPTGAGVQAPLELLAEVTVIVVTYNSAHCLAALDPLLGACPHVFISDNGSGDGTADAARRRWPHAGVLEHGRNLGFGAANNRALEATTTPFALLINPDCELPAAGLAELVRHAQAMPEAAMLAPQLVSASGRPDINYRWPRTLWRSRGPAADGPLCVGFLTGAAMLLRRERCGAAGFFDEDFFLYYEDDDLCLRLFQARLPMVLVPAVVAMHRNRGSVRGAKPWRGEYWRGYHHAQSKLTYALKHRSRLAARRLYWATLATTALALPFRALIFNRRLLARMLGRWFGLLHWSGHAG